MKKLFTLGYLSVLSGLILILLSVQIGIVRPGSGTATEMIAALIFMYSPLLILDIFYRDIAVNSFYFEMQKGVTRIQRIHRSTFPNVLQQSGAIGVDLINTASNQRRSTGRQRGAAPQAKQQSGSKDDSEGDGEPPRIPALFPLLPLLFTYIQFALLIGCSAKTLRNKVSAGLFPQPIQTAFGPRFTQSHLALVLTPRPSAPQSVAQKRGPGRPRLAMSDKKGVYRG